jgi:hypothetical protein
MDIAFIILTVLLIIFAVLAVYDGFFLHIFMFELHKYKESKFEHRMHTIRAILFPPMVYFLFVIQDCTLCFFIGIGLVLADIIVLAVDAFMEKDSRAFMGGLPSWEYILHLFVNGFHFATIAVYLTLKLHLSDQGFVIVSNFDAFRSFDVFRLVSLNLIPGGILLAIIHLITSFRSTTFIWDMIRDKISCCRQNIKHPSLH